MSNILLDDNNYIKICDFSLSTSKDLESLITKGIGTLPFMAPVLIDESDYNEKIDVYVFGVVIYFIVTKGQLPKRKGFRNSYESIEFPKSINNLSKSIIRKCLYSSQKRPSFAMILNEIVKNNFTLFNEIERKIPRIKKHLGL